MVTIPGNRVMPLAHLETLRREKQTLSMSLLSGPDFRQVDGDGFVLRTDVTGRGPEALVGGLAQARAAFDAAFPGEWPAPQAPLALYVFARQEEFNQVVAFDELALTHVPLTGQYAPDGQSVYLSAGEKPMRLTARVVAHEVAHHFVDQRFYRGAESPPFWVSEGIAAFIENLADPPEPTAPVDLASLERGLQSDKGYTWMADADRYLRRLQDVTRDGAALPVADLMAGIGVDGTDRTMPYGLSWLLVHYLMNGNGGAHRGAFREWLDTKPAVSAQQLLGRLEMTPAELAGALEGYRRSLEKEKPAGAPPKRSVR